MKSFPSILLAGLIAASMVGVGVAQDKEKTAEMYSPEEMAAWQKAAAPGPHHARFKNMVGAWNAKNTYWMQPGGDPQVATMKAEYKTKFDGRYLVSKLEGPMMGMPFEGMGIAGYDNVKGVHTMVWCDNMSTSILYSEGECSDECQVETLYMDQKDPITGNDMKVKIITRIIDNDKHVFEYYMINPDGSEFKSMEIVYTRP